jgi:hypothetical protein
LERGGNGGFKKKNNNKKKIEGEKKRGEGGILKGREK